MISHWFLRRVRGALLPCLLVVTGCGGQVSVESLGNTSSGVGSVEIVPTNPSVAKGTSTQLTATAIYSDNNHADVSNEVTWVASNSAVATVSATGLITSVGVGTATISATCRGANVCGSLSGTAALTVTAATLVSIALTPPIPSMATGATEQFTATGTFSDNTTQNLGADLTWISSNPSVATVSSSGLVSTWGGGSATISAACNISNVCAAVSGAAVLTVTSATLLSIAITPATPSVALGSHDTFSATGTYSDASSHSLTREVTWMSASAAVATISNASGSAGVASSVTAGTTQITAVFGSLTSPAIGFTVTPATLVSIAITPESPTIALDSGATLTAIGTYSDNSTQTVTRDVTWMSATPAVATVSNASASAGIVFSASPGTTQITAVLGGVSAAAITLTVNSVTLRSIVITPPVFAIALGGSQTATATATGTYSDGSTQILTPDVTWVSLDTSVAVISNAQGTQGLVTGLQGGTTSLSATLGGIASSAATLTVTTLVDAVLHSFGQGGDGVSPRSSLVQGVDGNFYGTSQYGGANGNGAVFTTTRSGLETVLWSFTGGNDGGNPAARLIQGADGNFYGTTQSGGAYGQGTVFKITLAGVETVLWSFGTFGDGQSPSAGLILGTDENLYGTTTYGGTNGQGTVFKISLTGLESVLWSFGAAGDGQDPLATLVLGSGGIFYGTTDFGGDNDGGTIFEITAAGVETVLWSFGSGIDGLNPAAELTRGTDGNFYGTTRFGGAHDDGTAFELTAAGVETTLWSFGNGNDGAYPYAVLIEGTDGNLYGTTFSGGANAGGTIFQLTPAGVEAVLWSFGGAGDGANPVTGLIQSSDGKFYGTTLNGGTNNDGIVFEF